MKPRPYTNYHMHTHYCDGKSRSEEYVLKALEKGMLSIGINAHAPVHFHNTWSIRREQLGRFIVEMEELKEKYRGRLEIYTGLEMDYLEGWEDLLIDEESGVDYRNRLDYRIGSVHYMFDAASGRYFVTDGEPDEVAETFDVLGRGDNRKCVWAYYKEVIRILREEKFDILGHLDIIKKRNGDNLYFREQEDWYREAVNEVLDEAKAAGVIVEVNTGGMLRGYIRDTYPSRWIIEECYKKGIPIMLNSDAHRAEDIAGGFEDAIRLLNEVGLNRLMVLKEGKWVWE